MTENELLTIGAFARLCGVTASALRFYADSAVLTPAVVDRSSCYRYYAYEQVERASLIRQLREMDMSLAQVVAVLDAEEPDTAAGLIDEHVAGLAERVRVAHDLATAAKAALESGVSIEPRSVITVPGAVFVTAVEQVLTATTFAPNPPVLNGLHFEAGRGELTITATDRYRLATRTVPTVGHEVTEWSRTIDAEGLRAVTSWIRRQPHLRLRASSTSVEMCGESGDQRRCRILAEKFPDYRLMLASLPEPRTRVLVDRHRLLETLETYQDRRVRVAITGESDAIAVSTSCRELPTRLAGRVTGPAIAIDFDITTLHPAVSSGIGKEVLLEFADPEQPVVVRSADTGDLTTVAMPIQQT